MLVIAAVAGAGNVDPYNIVWTNQSSGSVDSMPLAGGNLGLNVWVEKNDLLFLISSPNCMDENGMQVKLGLVRLKFAPAIFGKTFRQELRLDRSEIVINGKTASGQSASVTLWCDMDHPVIHAEFGSGEPVNITASYETWSSYQAQFRDGGIQWMRRLPEQNPRRLHDMQAQGMSEFADKIPDPLSKLTCGGRLDARDIAEAGTVSSKFNGMDTRGIAIKTRESVKRLDLTITLRMEQDETVQAWEIALNRDAQKARSCNLSRTRRQALEWWKKFWDRSYIIIAPTSVDKLENDKPWQVARNYQLFRYMLSGNASGRMMTLFNGGLFACDGNPDRRMWDGCQFMAQNQRLVYWPLLRSGDFDMLKVGLDVYRDRTPMSRLHAKKFWGGEGGVAFS